jgi:hypothetical protein
MGRRPRLGERGKNYGWKTSQTIHIRFRRDNETQGEPGIGDMWIEDEPAAKSYDKTL